MPKCLVSKCLVTANEEMTYIDNYCMLPRSMTGMTGVYV